MKKPKPAMMTSYLLETPKGQRKVMVPADWTVTFGPTAPWARQSSSDNYVWSLRFYSRGKKLRACFCDVKSFRDETMAVIEVPENAEKLKEMTKPKISGGPTKWPSPPSVAGIDEEKPF